MFNKGQVITHKGKLFRCIVVDKELAVFAALFRLRTGGYRTKMDRLFAVSNTEESGFEYELTDITNFLN